MPAGWVDALEIASDYYVQRQDGAARFKRLVKIEDDELVLAALNRGKYRDPIRIERSQIIRMASPGKNTAPSHPRMPSVGIGRKMRDQTTDLDEVALAGQSHRVDARRRAPEAPQAIFFPMMVAPPAPPPQKQHSAFAWGVLSPRSTFISSDARGYDARP